MVQLRLFKDSTFVQITDIESQIDKYSNKVSTYMTNSMASAFGDLYGTWFPFVLLSSLFSFILLRKPRAVEQKAIV
jgi:predicted PurR-regulated permease PerM